MYSEYELDRPAGLSDAEWHAMLLPLIDAKKAYEEKQKQKRDAKKAKKMANQIVVPNAPRQNQVITGQVAAPIPKKESAPIRNETFSLEQLKEIYNSFDPQRQELVKLGLEWFTYAHKRTMSPEEVYELYKVILLLFQFRDRGLKGEDLSDFFFDALVQTFGAPPESSSGNNEEQAQEDMGQRLPKPKFLEKTEFADLSSSPVNTPATAAQIEPPTTMDDLFDVFSFDPGIFDDPGPQPLALETEASVPPLSPSAEVARGFAWNPNEEQLSLSEEPDTAANAQQEAQLIVAPVARRMPVPVAFEFDARGVLVPKAVLDPELLQGRKPPVITDEEYQKRNNPKSSLYPYHFLKVEYNRPNSSGYDSYLNRESWVRWGVGGSHWAYDPNHQVEAEKMRQAEIKSNLENIAVPSQTEKRMKAFLRKKNKQGYARYAGEGTRGGKDVQYSWLDSHRGIYRPTEQIKAIYGALPRAESNEYKHQYPEMPGGPGPSLLSVINNLNPHGLEKASEIGRANEFLLKPIDPALLTGPRASAEIVTSIDEDEAAANKKRKK